MPNPRPLQHIQTKPPAPFAAYVHYDGLEAYRIIFEGQIFPTDDRKEADMWMKRITQAGGTYVFMNYSCTPREERAPW